MTNASNTPSNTPTNAAPVAPSNATRPATSPNAPPSHGSTQAHHDSKSRVLDIQGMKGDECCKSVTNALKGVNGVTTESVEVGTAKISCSNDAACDSACAAIGKSGFTAKARPSSGSASGGSNSGAHSGTNPSGTASTMNAPKKY